MEDWIKGLIADAVRPIRDLAAGVRARIAAVYQTFVNVFARVRRSFNGWVDRGRAWLSAQVAHAAATLTRLRWIITVLIPRRLGMLADSIQAWTRARLGELAARLRAEAGQVAKWLSDLVTGLYRALTQVRDYLLARVREILSDLSRIRLWVGSLLTDPGRLAAWLVAAMAEALATYVLNHADQWAEALYRRRRNAEATALALAERIVDRIA